MTINLSNEKTKVFDTGRIRIRLGIIPKKTEEGTIAAGTFFPNCGNINNIYIFADMVATLISQVARAARAIASIEAVVLHAYVASRQLAHVV